MHYVYFAVEGPHDIEFVGRFLKLHGLKRVQHKPRLASFWTPLLPKSWPSPPGSTDLLKRVPVPVFFQNQDVSVAIDSVTGDSQLLSGTINTRSTLEQPGGETLHAIGVILDSDQDESALARFTTIAKGLAAEKLPLATAPGQVVAGPGSESSYFQTMQPLARSRICSSSARRGSIHSSSRPRALTSSPCKPRCHPMKKATSRTS